MTQQYVYFIRPIGADGPVKIGCSITPIGRLETLMTWSPVPLEIVATVPGTFDLERNIHECLWDLHSHREWFRADPRINAVIARLKKGLPIEKAMNLDDRVQKASRKAARWAANPEGRVRCSYSMKLSWAQRQFRGDDVYASLPDDVSLIMDRWRQSQRVPYHEHRSPTPAELARLDEVIAAPAKHVILSSWGRAA